MKSWIKYLLLVLGAILWGIIFDFSEGILAVLLIVYVDLNKKKTVT